MQPEITPVVPSSVQERELILRAALDAAMRTQALEGMSPQNSAAAVVDAGLAALARFSAPNS